MIAWLRRVLGLCSPSLRALGKCRCADCHAKRERAKRKRAGALVGQYLREADAEHRRAELAELALLLADPEGLRRQIATMARDFPAAANAHYVARLAEEKRENERLRKHIETTRPNYGLGRY